MLSLLHTPDGVRDYHGQELSDRAMICDRLRKVFESRGYTEVVTPVFEYFDIFNAERGSVSSRNSPSTRTRATASRTPPTPSAATPPATCGISGCSPCGTCS